MKCYHCKKELKKTIGDYHYTASGLNHIFLKNVEIQKCACGEEYVSIPCVYELHDLISKSVIEKEFLLTGDEIRFLRKEIGLKAKEFADYMGVDASTVSRWEKNKQVIDKSRDRLIRIIYCNYKGIDVKKMIEQRFKNIFERGEVSDIFIPIDELFKKEGNVQKG